MKITEELYHELNDSYEGICLACGEYRENCEPDASHYPCESCGLNEVFGVEEALMLGELEIS